MACLSGKTLHRKPSSLSCPSYAPHTSARQGEDGAFLLLRAGSPQLSA